MCIRDRHGSQGGCRSALRQDGSRHVPATTRPRTPRAAEIPPYSSSRAKREERRVARSVFFALLAGLGAVACDSTRPLPPAVFVAPATLTLEDGQSAKLTAT